MDVAAVLLHLFERHRVPLPLPMALLVLPGQPELIPLALELSAAPLQATRRLPVELLFQYLFGRVSNDTTGLQRLDHAIELRAEGAPFRRSLVGIVARVVVPLCFFACQLFGQPFHAFQGVKIIRFAVQTSAPCQVIDDLILPLGLG